MILAVSARERLALRQFDVSTAFLNAGIEEDVYLCPPKGAEYLAGGKERVLKLGRMLYGLHQAPRGWSKKLENALRELGFVQSDMDPSLWLVKDDTGAVVAMFYVDDGLVAAPTAEKADAIVDKMGTVFEIRKLGEPTDYLGIIFIGMKRLVLSPLTKRTTHVLLQRSLG
jgi:hypothetical protein